MVYILSSCSVLSTSTSAHAHESDRHLPRRTQAAFALKESKSGLKEIALVGKELMRS